MLCNAQQAVSSAGGNATGTFGSVRSQVVTGLEEAKGVSLEFSLFPNPTSDYLRLTIDDYNIENLSCQLCDLSGKLLSKNDIIG